MVMATRDWRCCSPFLGRSTTIPRWLEHERGGEAARGGGCQGRRGKGRRSDEVASREGRCLRWAQKKMGQIFKWRRGLASLVLWEQKSLGSTGPWLRVPAGERALAYHEQVCCSLYPALTASLGRELLVVPPVPSRLQVGPGVGALMSVFSGCAMMWTGWHLQRLSSNLICKEPSLQFLVPVTPKVLGWRWEEVQEKRTLAHKPRTTRCLAHTCQLRLKTGPLASWVKAPLSWWPGRTGVAVSAPLTQDSRLGRPHPPPAPPLPGYRKQSRHREMSLLQTLVCPSMKWVVRLGL